MTNKMDRIIKKLVLYIVISALYAVIYHRNSDQFDGMKNGTFWDWLYFAFTFDAIDGIFPTSKTMKFAVVSQQIVLFMEVMDVLI